MHFSDVIIIDQSWKNQKEKEKYFSDHLLKIFIYVQQRHNKPKCCFQSMVSVVMCTMMAVWCAIIIGTVHIHRSV